VAKTEIHNTAIVHPGASIADGVNIGAYSIIEDDVTIGPGTIIGPHVVIESHTTIGQENIIRQFSSLGAAPQDTKYKGEPTKLIIGDGNDIREYVTMSRGTVGGNGETVVGSNCMFMVSAHVGHDCVLGDNVVVANAAALGGHCVVQSDAVIGAQSGLHQMVRIGKGAMFGAHSAIVLDVVPYTMATGLRAKLIGLNKVGLARKGVTAEDIKHIQSAYKIIFKSSLKVADALDKVRTEIEQTTEVVEMVKFIEESKRGIVR